MPNRLATVPKTQLAPRPRQQHGINVFGHPAYETRRERRKNTTDSFLFTMTDIAPVMMWLSGPDYRRTNFNRTWMEFIGRASDGWSHEDWVEAIHPEDRSRCLAFLADACEKRVSFTIEYRLACNDGRHHWICDKGVPRYDSDGGLIGYIGCCNDVSEAKESDLARTELTCRLISAQEEERSRIARELHDGIGNDLALLTVQIQTAGRISSKDPQKAKPQLQELCRSTNDIASKLRNVSHQLHSAELEYLGLSVGVQALCREVSNAQNIAVDCNCEDIRDDLDKNIALCVYRVLQEALHNIAKHSYAQTARIELVGRNHRIFVKVSDDGIGFEPDEKTNRGGLGLLSMRERVHLAGGSFFVWSKRGEGTRIEFSVRS
jgi:PAS domain S-box-containing protein